MCIRDRFTSLTASVEKLALNMENMLKEQEAQGNRLEALEDRDGEKWRTMISYVGTTAVSYTHLDLCAEIQYKACGID